MTKVTPKGRTPSLIGGTNGRPKRVLIQRLSECYRCHDGLVKGTHCIEIPILGGPYSSSKRMCDDCFQKMLMKTAEDLQEVMKL